MVPAAAGSSPVAHPLPSLGRGCAGKPGRRSHHDARNRRLRHARPDPCRRVLDRRPLDAPDRARPGARPGAVPRRRRAGVGPLAGPVRPRADPHGRARRGGRARRDPVQRRHRHRDAAAARVPGSGAVAGARRHVPDGRGDRRRRALAARHGLDARGPDRRGARTNRSGGHVLRPRPTRDRRAVGHHAGGRGRDERPRRHRADDRDDRARDERSRHPARRRPRVRRRDGDRRRVRPHRRAAHRPDARPRAPAERKPLPGARARARVRALRRGVSRARLGVPCGLPRRPGSRRRAAALQVSDRAIPRGPRGPRRTRRVHRPRPDRAPVGARGPRLCSRASRCSSSSP